MRELAGLLFLFIAAELVALLIVCVQAWRNPHGKEPASRVPAFPPDDDPNGGIFTKSDNPRTYRFTTWIVPDHIPDDFGGEPTATPPHGGIDIIDGSVPHGSDWVPHLDDPDGSRGGPYDQLDDLPGWGVPNGDTKPATDTPSGDRGVGGEGP